jgi:hypothetical protein
MEDNCAGGCDNIIMKMLSLALAGLNVTCFSIMKVNQPGIQMIDTHIAMMS